MRERDAQLAGARREHRRLEMPAAGAMPDAQRAVQKRVPVDTRDQLDALSLGCS